MKKFMFILTPLILIGIIQLLKNLKTNASDLDLYFLQSDHAHLNDL